MILKIGTRGSKLALAQSQWVKKRIEIRYPHIQADLVTIKTTGDKTLDSPLSSIGGKGLFVKEIEDALIREEIDVAVHSMKDVPALLPAALMLSTFPEREDPRDALISLGDRDIEALPQGSAIGTSSLRRAAQILHLRPDLNIFPLRGNVETRLRKLRSGDFQAIILATAGIKRLGLATNITQVISLEQFLPAIGQGALGLEVRRSDEHTINLLDFLNHKETEVTIRAERALLKELEGGCQVPIAGLAHLKDGRLHLEGLVAELDGSKIIRDEISSRTARAEELGIELARRLLESGADKILTRIYKKELSAIKNGTK